MVYLLINDTENQELSCYFRPIKQLALYKIKTMMKNFWGNCSVGSIDNGREINLSDEPELFKKTVIERLKKYNYVYISMGDYSWTIVIKSNF